MQGLVASLRTFTPRSKWRHRTCTVSRRALIITNAVGACLFGLAGVANIALGEPMNFVAGISALAVGACAAVTTCLFVSSGGWRKEKVTAPDHIGDHNDPLHERR